MTEKEIISIYDQGPEAVKILVQGLLEVIEKQNKTIEQQSKRIVLLNKRVQDL